MVANKAGAWGVEEIAEQEVGGGFVFALELRMSRIVDVILFDVALKGVAGARGAVILSRLRGADQDWERDQVQGEQEQKVWEHSPCPKGCQSRT